MQQIAARITIPDNIAFADLQLSRDSDGAVSFRWSVIERICKASGLSVDLVAADPEEHVAALIVAWYQAHRQQGGAPDPVAEDLIAEVEAEECAGQRVSLPPGRA